MEAHEPYTRRWPIKLIHKIYLKTALEGKCPSNSYKFVKNYPQSAEIAVKAAVKMAQDLADDKTLVVVTSEHGQGLCDPGFLHGYWLYDGLIRVPLWVKYPGGVNPPPQEGKYVSLTEILALVRYVINE